MLEELLKEFKEKHETPYDFVKEGDSPHFFLEISKEFRIELRPLDKGGVFFRANLFLLLDPDRESLFRRLLEANFLYQSTMGFILGLDPNEKYVTLSHYHYSEMDKNLLWDTLEQFCNAIDYLRHNFEKKS